MAKINLREYNREIENLLENGQNDQAIAHCHQILKVFPRHLATHRLLGKAFLELQRYEEAARVFQQVLDCIPDDFVSHLGMSVIREHEGDLGAAVWHMERAFDIQPANANVQGELRRLYKQRDGLEPQKIHLTRGALARMYAKGDLYPQSISELRGALAEDPARPDLQIVLAKMFVKSGQLLEAADTCKSLLNKLPDCMEAHIIQASILSKIDRSAEGRIHYQRAAAMDPYIAHVPEGQDAVEVVPDDAVMVEKLEDTGEEEVPSNFADQVWSEPSLATLSGDGGAGSVPSQEGTFPGEEKSKEEIPDWMQSAGWKPSTGAGDEAVASRMEAAETEPGEGEDELVRAEIPDWIKPLAPPEVYDSYQEETEEPFVEEESLTAFEASEPEGTEEPVRWAEPSEPAEVSEPGQEAEQDMGDWLSNLLKENEGKPTAEAEMAAEMEVLPQAETGGAGIFPVEAEAEPESEAGGLEEGEQLPDWLTATAGTGAAGAAETAEVGKEAELPDWLREASAEVTEEAEEEPEMPDWLQSLSEGASQEEDFMAVSPEDEMEEAGSDADVPDWLKSLGDEQPVEESELNPFEDDKQFLPEEETPVISEVEEPAGGTEVPDWLRTVMEQEQEETEQPEDVPDWLKSSIPEGFPEEPAPITGDTKPVFVHRELEQPESAWAPEVEEAPSAEFVDEAQQAEEIPQEIESLPEVREEMEAAEAWEEPTVPGEEAIPTAEVEEEDAAMAWLESLAAREGALEEELLTRPEERTDSIPDWLQQMATDETGEAGAEMEGAFEGEMEIEEPVLEEPDWLKSMTVEEPEDAGSGIEEDLEGDLVSEETGQEQPDWLKQMAVEETFEDEAVLEGEPSVEEPAMEQPDWLKETEGEVEAQAPAAHQEAVQGEDELPDWLREFTEGETTPSVEDIAPAADSILPPTDLYDDIPAEEAVEEEMLPEEEVVEESAAGSIQVGGEQPEVTPFTAHEEVMLEADTASHPTVLAEAWSKMVGGEVDRAIETYSDLIHKEQHLEQVIHDLREAAYLYPQEVMLHQTLGDAYLRKNRLQEALDAYNKAEDLLNH